MGIRVCFNQVDAFCEEVEQWPPGSVENGIMRIQVATCGTKIEFIRHVHVIAGVVVGNRLIELEWFAGQSCGDKSSEEERVWARAQEVKAAIAKHAELLGLKVRGGLFKTVE